MPATQAHGRVPRARAARRVLVSSHPISLSTGGAGLAVGPARKPCAFALLYRPTARSSCALFMVERPLTFFFAASA